MRQMQAVKRKENKMGYFTWTDGKKEPRTNKYGEYHRADLIAHGGYDGFCKVVCPDNTEIIEPYYQGYGRFGGKDIFDLVVDWNKEHLKDIFQRLENKNPKFWGKEFANLAAAYQEDDADRFQKELDALSAQFPIMEKEWKRHIGITIGNDYEDNKELPYPIKITSKKWHVAYDNLVPSRYCQ